MYSADAQAEIKAMQDVSWTDVVQMQRPNSYLVNPTTFASRIISLANLIEMLDMTTAYTNNKSVGIRIGNMEPQSIGYALGFIPGDVITKVVNLAPTTTAQRMKIYNNIIQLPMGSDVPVQFLRKEQLLTYTYRLFNLADIAPTVESFPVQLPPAPLPPQAPPVQQMPTATSSSCARSWGTPCPASSTATRPIPQVPPKQHIEAHHAALAQEQQKTRGAIRQIRKTERDAMKNYGSKAAMVANP